MTGSLQRQLTSQVDKPDALHHRDDLERVILAARSKNLLEDFVNGNDRRRKGSQRLQWRERTTKRGRWP